MKTMLKFWANVYQINVSLEINVRIYLCNVRPEFSLGDYGAKKNLPSVLSKLSNILQLRKVSMSLHYSPSERLFKYSAAFVHNNASGV